MLGENNHHWIGIRLRAQVSNRDGILSQCRVKAGDWVQTDGLGSQGGDSNAHCAIEILFDSGPHHVVRWIDVQWLSGRQQQLNEVSADRVVTITEPEGLI